MQLGINSYTLPWAADVSLAMENHDCCPADRSREIVRMLHPEATP